MSHKHDIEEGISSYLYGFLRMSLEKKLT